MYTDVNRKVVLTTQVLRIIVISMENEAQKKLKAWLDDGGRKVSWLAQKVRANRSTVHQWLNGKQKPNPNYRVAIEEITGGEVPASEWG